MTTSRQRRTTPKAGAKSGGNGDVTDYRSELWRMADALRGSMDAAEYKHVVLGLIFLKYISDAFEERRAQVLAEAGKMLPRTRTSTPPRTFSGCLPKPAGRRCNPRLTSPP